MDQTKHDAQLEAEKQSVDIIEDVTNGSGPLRLSLDLNDIKENVGLQEYVEARKEGIQLVKIMHGCFFPCVCI